MGEVGRGCRPDDRKKCRTRRISTWRAFRMGAKLHLDAADDFMKDPIRDTINQKFENNFVKYIKFTLDRREVPTSDYQQEFKEMIQKIAPEGDDV